MSLILKGRRAKKYLGAARNRLDSMKLSGAPYLGAALTLPGGKAIIQKLGEQDRIIIDVRDPYFACYIRTRNDAGGDQYAPYYGGVSGEPFLPETPISGIGRRVFIGTTLIANVGNGAALGTFSEKNILPSVTIGTAPYQVDTLLRTDLIFSVFSYRLGMWSIIPYAIDVACTLRGQPIVFFEPVGEVAAGQAVAFAKMTIEATPGERYDIIAKITDPAGKSEPELIWPPAALNSGRPDLATISSQMTCYGRGNVIFVQSYVSDWRMAPTVPRMPDIVRLSEFGTMVQVDPILSAMPSLAALVSSGELDINVGTDFAFSGENHITAVINVGATDYRLFTSADAGASWAAIGWPPGGTEALFPAGFDEHSIYSMYKGQVEFFTYQASSGSYFRYTSTDHGFTYVRTPVQTTEAQRRDCLYAAPLAYDADGVPTKYAYMTADQKIAVYSGVSFTDKLYEVALPTGDYTQVGTEDVLFPTLCFLGSNEFPSPIKTGHPHILEYPA